jgi:cob(I)alamin adenosyltransferase
MMFKRIHRGDDGYTDVIGGRVTKDSPIIEFIGELDELISFIGLVKAYLKSSGGKDYEHIAAMLAEIQQRLMHIASYVATLGRKSSPISKDVLNSIDRTIEDLSSKISVPRGFIIPGSSIYSSLFHVVRAICRRVERKSVRLLRENIIDNNAYVYINRLSDLFYLLALYLDKINDVTEDVLLL